MANDMKQQSLTWISWKKLIITSVIITIILIAVYLYSIFNYIDASKTDGFSETESTILAETNMTTIDHMFTFQDDILYHIAYARDKEKKEWIVFVPKTQVKDKVEKEDETASKKKVKEKSIVTLEATKMIAQDDIESNWMKACESCTLKSSSPAMIDDVPLWELTYVDDKGRFVIEYRYLKDGETYEQLKIRRKYNMKG